MQILAKISGGFALRGALNYDFAPCKKTGKPRAELICGTLQGSPRQICKQAAPLRGLRDIAKPIWRCSLNADPGDGIISAEKWTEICHDFLIGMGLNPDTAAWVAVRHTDHHDDTSNQRDHVHLTVLRQQVNGSLFNVSNDVFRSKKVTEQLEIKHQLNKHNREPAQRRAPTVAQQSAFKRTGKMATQQTIQNKVDQVIKEEKNNLSFPKFKEKLRGKHIGILPKISKEGRLMGFSYEDFETGVKMPGSKLGTDYSVGLLARGLKFDAKEVQEEQKLASKMPPALKSILLPEQYGAKQIAPHAAHQTEVSLDTEKFNTQVINLNVGPASTAMLLIAGVLAKASLSLVNMVIAFLKRLLAFFGFGMRQSSHQAHQHPDASAPPLCYEPTKLAALPAPKSAEDKVAMELYQVARALEENDPSLLPVLDDEEVSKARAEVVFAMENDEKDDGLAGASAAAAESDIFGIKQEDFSSAPSIDPIDGLKTALKACVMANFYHEKAGRKNVPLHIDVSDEKQKLVDQIILARKKAENDFVTWKVDQGYFKSRLPSSTKNNFESEIARLEKLEIESKNDHQNEVIKTAKYEKQLKDSPAPIVPATVTAAAESARSALLRARQSVQNQAILTIDALRRDPKQVAKMGVFEFELSKSLKEFHESEQISDAEMNVLERQFNELKKLKTEQDQSGFVPPVSTDFETDDDVDKPVIDGQIVK